MRLRWDLRRLSIVIQNVEESRPELVLRISAKSSDKGSCGLRVYDTEHLCNLGFGIHFLIITGVRSL